MQLRACWADLDAHLNAGAEPLGIARIVNLFPGVGDWRFTTRSDHEGRTIVDVQIDPPEAWPRDASAILSGIVPEVLNCTSLRIRLGDSTLVCYHVDDHRRADNYEAELPLADESTPSDSCLRLEGFWDKALPAAFSDGSLVVDFFRRQTWFGSSKYRATGRKVVWKVLAGPNVIVRTGSSIPDLVGLDLTLAAGDAQFNIVADTRIVDSTVRLADYGELAATDHMQPIRDALRTAGVGAFHLEVDGADLFSLGVFGRLHPREKLKGCVESIAAQIAGSGAIANYAGELAAARRQAAVERLNHRIQAAQSARLVLIDKVPLGSEPTSELATVALFAKIEALNKLPFRCWTREFARGEGIDVLADLRLDEQGYIETLAPTEFEFTFKNFLTHNHPHEHVRMVICWKLAYKKDDMHATDRPWLYKFDGDTGEIPVVAISELPGLEFQSPGG